jgi:hypothetical protein
LLLGLDEDALLSRRARVPLGEQSVRLPDELFARGSGARGEEPDDGQTDDVVHADMRSQIAAREKGFVSK